MKFHPKAFICLISAFLTLGSANAAINKDKAPFSLSLEQAFAWHPDSELADKNNISQQSLAVRFSDKSTQLNPYLESKSKVLIAPDGMNNFGNYLQPQSKFNLYNFAHWSQIDVLNWFAGTADQVVNIPARPWVETAHRNGVKVIGSVYLAIAQWGGNPEQVAAMLKKDLKGRYVMAHQLVEMAQFYGFDGWLINQETDLSAVKDEQNNLVKGASNPERSAEIAKEMLSFMRYLTKLAPQDMEIHWYDSMLEDGRIRWQNTLNHKNKMFLGEQDGENRASDAIFLNYWWNRDMVAASQGQAKAIGRDPYDVYTGVDLWPARNAQAAFRSTQWLKDIFSDELQQGFTSIALFGNNFNFNFSGSDKQQAFASFADNAQDYQRFYDTETRLFAGDDLNLSAEDSDWVGIGHFVPARSVISSLPFVTHFNTGHGLKRAAKGQIESNQQWHNMAEQDLLPSWQFAVQGNRKAKVSYDFDFPFQGGSSLKFSARPSQGESVIPLYKTRLMLTANSWLELATLADANSCKALIRLDFADGSSSEIDIHAATAISGKHQWQQQSHQLGSFIGKTLTRISLVIPESSVGQFDLRLGKLGVL